MKELQSNERGLSIDAKIVMNGEGNADSEMNIQFQAITPKELIALTCVLVYNVVSEATGGSHKEYLETVIDGLKQLVDMDEEEFQKEITNEE